jgi:hypothetical protein
MASNVLVSRIFPNATNFFYDMDEVDASVEGKKTFFGAFRNPVGIEVEMENAAGGIQNTIIKQKLLWKTTADNSLKNNGIELISDPVAGRGIDAAIFQLEALYEQFPKIDFSHRCSIHVHQNVADMTEQQVFRLMRYYALLEGALFSYAHPLRSASPFCYPIVACPPMLYNAIVRNAMPEMKYGAFNPAPISRQTTVEYRHLEGTKDVRKIRRWVQILCKLHRYVSNLSDEKEARDFEQIARGKDDRFAPFERMLGVHRGLFSDEVLDDSIYKGLVWVGALTTED